MRKLLSFLLLITFAVTAAQAQIRVKDQKIKLQTPVKTIDPAPVESKTPPPAAPPSPVNKSSNTGNQSIPVYSLTSVRISIRTGNDNKEFPSEVGVSLWLKNQAGYDYTKNCLFLVNKLKNEMRINSSTEFGLGKYDVSTEKFTLYALQRDGLKLTIEYIPNFFMDAWKIEGIVLTLEFRDQNGNLHPTLGTKAIAFNDAYGFLNGEYRAMVCLADNNLNSLTSSIVK
ncbi:MAG TPA: hypothetical protein VK666_13460 [Chryseolinea sp.]|nr:hypothetical protein [Chryseolinea sp.]